MKKLLMAAVLLAAGYLVGHAAALSAPHYVTIQTGMDCAQVRGAANCETNVTLILNPNGTVTWPAPQ